MQVIKSVVRVLLFIFPVVVSAQSTYLPQGDKSSTIIDRIEIKETNNQRLNFSSLKPYNRKYIVDEIQKVYTDSALGNNRSAATYSAVDRYNIESLLMNNSEWVTIPHPSFESKKMVLGSLYKTKANLFELNTKDLFIALNPILNYEITLASGNDKGAFINTRGITVRGLISNKIGFSTTLTDNQQQGPSYFNDRVNFYHQVPGVGFWKPFKSTGFDYFDARGYITGKIAKLVDVQFGYDNNFIGNGYRSLFLSDYSNSYLFLKLHLEKGKFNYQSIFAELFPSFIKTTDTLLDRKYAAFHHVSMNATKWLNIGLFEGVVFGTRNDFNIRYLNPIIFSRHIQGFNNSPDNALAGIDMKANFLHSFQVYGQLMLDEFDFSQLSKNNGYWANKTAYQIGVKYIDAFKIANLDLQVETNKVRPFTYAYNNSVANYTHYNVPLAHPLGANFQEYIAVAKYQPFAKWRLDGRIIAYKQGLDSGGVNFGSNPFSNTFSRTKDYGYTILSGNKVTCMNFALSVSYELRENLFLEAGLLYRNYKTEIPVTSSNSKIFSAGVRWNIFKKQYDL